MALRAWRRSSGDEQLSDGKKYSLLMGTEVCCRILGIDPDDMLRAAGLEHAKQRNGDVLVTTEQYFHAWNTMVALNQRPDYVTHLGVTIARGPVIPTFFALTCAPNLETGFKRLARYKSLLGPTQVRTYREGDLFWVEYHCVDSQIDIPASLGSVHLVFTVEAVRIATAHHLEAVAATLPSSTDERREIAGHICVMPERGNFCSLAFTEEDARRPFVSENPRLWKDFERDLEQQLASHRTNSSMSAQVKSCLLELFLTGRSSANDVCFEIGMSRSGLQRSLSAEGTSFQRILDQTREELAIRYLTKSTLSITEIATLVAYTDPNSFARGFRKWTGQSPHAFRKHNSAPQQ